MAGESVRSCATRGLHWVMVYGTLVRGNHNHVQFENKENGEARFIASVKTKDKYPLVVATKYNVPFILGDKGLGQV